VNRRSLLVIGAGPTGLAAALGAVRLGWTVTVLEKDGIGSSLHKWGATRFFSPVSMNVPPGATEILGTSLPPDDAILTGAEFAEAVLVPLATSGPLAGSVMTNHRVVAVGRAGLIRGDYFRHPIRSERGFRVLADTPDGEQVFEADAVIDASGIYDQPVSLGVGGIPARGERALSARLIRTLGALDDKLEELAGRAVLLVGHGHSAANAIVRLAQLATRAAGTRVIWATRSLNRRPCQEVAADPLPERQQIVCQANHLAMSPPAWLRVERRASIEAITPADSGSVLVSLTGGRHCEADEIVALTGYRPDLSILSELTVGIDPATEGASGLGRALSKVTDCLSTPAVAPEDLESGEPGFYLAGAKSYGRARTFLLKTGYDQLATILRQLDHGA
jgi:thioredoxin reductase